MLMFSAQVTIRVSEDILVVTRASLETLPVASSACQLDNRFDTLVTC